MSRANYSNIPITPREVMREKMPPRPTIINDGTALLRDNVCTNCGTGNRRTADRCFQCDTWFRPRPSPMRQSLRELTEVSCWHMCIELPFYAIWAVFRCFI